MKKITFVFYIILIGLLYSCQTNKLGSTNGLNNSKKERKMEEGKCFAKCLMPDQTASSTEEYAVYTGNELEEKVDLEVKEIVLQEKTTKWIKKKADRNCISKDLKDCLVWCLIEVPEVKETLKVLSDTTQSNNYEWKKIEYEVVTQKGGFTEWKTVLCEKNITKIIVGDIQNSLRGKEYYEGKDTQRLDALTKSALTKFQRDNNLPVGQLDYETLDLLGIVMD